MLQTFLSSIILISLGVLGGFALFHYALQDRMQQTEHNHNATMTIVQGLLLEAEAERARCTDQDDGRLQEMSELRGRLDAQYKNWYDLTASQRDLSDKHRAIVVEAQNYRERVEWDENELQTLATRLEERDRALDSTRRDLETKHAVMVELEARLEQKDRDLSAVREDLEINHRTRVELESQLTHMRELTYQKTQLEQETRQLRERIQEYDQELVNVKRNSEGLLNQRIHLEEEVAGLKANMDEMHSQLVIKDKELFEYREEEGNLEKKLINLREGMLGLLKEKVVEIQDLENQIENLHNEKVHLELKLDNWRDGMLALVKDKMEAIDHLKRELEESQHYANGVINEIEVARSRQGDVEETVKEKQDSIAEADPERDRETIAELNEIIARLNRDLEESRNWVERSTREIEERQLYHEESERVLSERSIEIEELRSKIKQEQDVTRETISRLESDLETARKLVEEKTTQIEALNEELSEFITQFKQLRSSLPGASSATESTTSDIIIDHVQQRDSVMCRQLFGKGPYYVRFKIRLPPNDGSDGEENTELFVIELPSRRQLPHSTYAFLTLVESNLYNDGTAFLFAEDFGLQIKSSLSPDVVSLEHKLKPLGLTGGSSLSFLETPTSGENLPCGEFSFGFDHRGPGLNLFLSDSGDGATDCFARVIRGQENLPKIQSLVFERGEPLEIVSATHLRVD